jgi:hypothetical protein
MRDGLASRAEILKLARLLRREPESLAYLETVRPDDLRALREQTTEVLFSAQSAALGRLAAASRVLPVGLVATIGERAFGPVLSARITGMLDPGRAVEVAERLPTSFLADVAVELDPRRANEVIARIPPRRISEITRELVRRREYVTMGRFVGHLGDESVTAAVSVMDDSTLLQVAFVLETKDGLDHLIELLGPARLDALIAAAAREELWIEVLGLLGNLSERRRRELAQQAGEQGEGILEAIVRTAAEHELWLELLPLAPALPPEGRQRVVQEIARLDPARRGEITEQARAAGFDDELALLAEALDSLPG